MKRIITVLALVLFANFAFAQDDITIGIDNENNITATGGNATAQQDQHQSQVQEQNTNFSTKRQHIIAQPGPSGSFVSGMNIALPAGCTPITGSISMKKAYKMAQSGSFAEKKGGMWHGIFSSRIKSTPYIDFEGKASKDNFYFYEWDPMKAIIGWDSVTIENFCEGDYGYPLGSSLGKCLEEARETVNASHVLACYTVRYDNHASGASLGAGTTGSVIKGGENDTRAGSVAIGGLMGTTVGYYNKAYDVYLVGLDAAYDYQPPVVESKPVFVPPPPPPAPLACDVTIFDKIIIGIDIELPKCLWPCHNNQKLRFAKGNALMDKFFCSGNKDMNLLIAAIHEYGVAERDFENGRELKKGQKFGEKPKGPRTPTIAGARDLNYKVHYNWSLAVRILKGRDAQVAFAQIHGLKTMPSEQGDMKR